MVDRQNRAFSISRLFPLTQGLPALARRTDTSSAYVATREYGSGLQAGEDGFTGRVPDTEAALAMQRAKRRLLVRVGQRSA